MSAKLAGGLGNRRRQHAVQPDCGQQQRQPAEDREDHAEADAEILPHETSADPACIAAGSA